MTTHHDTKKHNEKPKDTPLKSEEETTAQKTESPPEKSTEQPNSFAEKPKTFEIESLLKSGFNRTLERFFPYLLTQILLFFGIVGLSLLLGLVGAAHVFLYTATKSLPLTIVSGLFFTITLIIYMGYFTTWGALAGVQSLIADKKIGSIQAFREVKSGVWQYLILQLLIGLFMLGLLPFGIFTIFLLYVLWAIWAMFVVFIFLKEKQGTLTILWKSRAMVNQKGFWAILGRVALLYLVSFAVSFGIGILSEIEPGIGTLASIAFNLFAGPFFLSYIYEMFIQLPFPKNVEKPQTWTTLSIVGWILMVLAVTYMASVVMGDLTSIIQNLMESNDLQQLIPQEDNVI